MCKEQAVFRCRSFFKKAFIKYKFCGSTMRSGEAVGRNTRSCNSARNTGIQVENNGLVGFVSQNAFRQLPQWIHIGHLDYPHPTDKNRELSSESKQKRCRRSPSKSIESSTLQNNPLLRLWQS